MTLSHDDTKKLIERVLDAFPKDSRMILHHALGEMNRTEPEFYGGVIEHGPGLAFTSDQWFDFFSKIPLRIFGDEPKLMNKLSENQRKQLPFLNE